jgi:hypothetical protein
MFKNVKFHRVFPWTNKSFWKFYVDCLILISVNNLKQEYVARFLFMKQNSLLID